jgi:hypothetical protein
MKKYLLVKKCVLLLGLLWLVGCGSSVTPLVAGRALLGSGGCGAPPPDGICQNPVVYSSFANARLRVFLEADGMLVAATDADKEGRFSLSLQPGLYRVMAEQMPGHAIALQITDPSTPITLSFYEPPP